MLLQTKDIFLHLRCKRGINNHNNKTCIRFHAHGNKSNETKPKNKSQPRMLLYGVSYTCLLTTNAPTPYLTP